MEFEEYDYTEINKLAAEYYKSSSWYRSQMNSEMTNSDIAEFIIDKQVEINSINYDRLRAIKGKRDDGRKIIDLLFDDEVTAVQKIINSFKYELNMRNPNRDKYDIVEKLANAKLNINIVDLIESVAGIRLKNGRQLNKCPLDSHKEKTASFKVYEDTNSWYCFGCKKGGDAISFIENMTNCSKGEAIKKFISLDG